MIRVGDIVPVMLQLPDGNPELMVEARIIDSKNELLAVLELSHVGRGLYSNLDFIMPNEKFITAQYRILNSDLYEQVSDIFMATGVDEPKEMILTGTVTEVRMDIKEGVICEIKSN